MINNEITAESKHRQTLTQEQLDVINQLRLEISSLSPEENEKVRALTRRIAETFYELFGGYIPENKATADEIANLVVIVEEDNHINNNNSSNEVPPFPDDDDDNKMGTLVWELKKYRGRFIPGFLRSRYESQVKQHSKNALGINTEDKSFPLIILNKTWISADASLYKLDLEKLHPDLDPKSFEEIVEFTLVLAISHEVAHQLGNTKLPTLLREIGARYYAWQVLRKLGFDNVPLQAELSALIIYDQILQKFKTDLHRLFFADDVPIRKAGPKYRGLTLELYKDLRFILRNHLQ
jgi:hypothetical protein